MRVKYTYLFLTLLSLTTFSIVARNDDHLSFSRAKDGAFGRGKKGENGGHGERGSSYLDGGNGGNGGSSDFGNGGDGGNGGDSD